MVRWKIAAVVGLLFGVCGTGWGYAQRRNAVGFYELRVYKAQPGKRDALAARFESRIAAIFARHGITNVGYWIPQESDPELGISAPDMLIYMRGYPSREERDKRLKAARADPEFVEVVTSQERDPKTRVVEKVHNIDMLPSNGWTAISLTK
jgi:NIPSNAP protein